MFGVSLFAAEAYIIKNRNTPPIAKPTISLFPKLWKKNKKTPEKEDKNGIAQTALFLEIKENNVLLTLFLMGKQKRIHPLLPGTEIGIFSIIAQYYGASKLTAQTGKAMVYLDKTRALYQNKISVKKRKPLKQPWITWLYPKKRKKTNKTQHALNHNIAYAKTTLIQSSTLKDTLSLPQNIENRSVSAAPAFFLAPTSANT